MKEAIAYFNQLVALDTAAARRQYELLYADMEARNVRYAGQVMQTLLRPYLISEEQDRELRFATETVMAIVAKAERALFAGHPQWVYDFLGFSETERGLLQVDPGYPASIVFTRLDGFFNENRLQFIEFNHDSPGGIGYSDRLVEILRPLPLMERLAEKYELRYDPLQPKLLEAILSTYREYGGSTTPAVAIVDWADVKTRHDFEIIRDFFRAHGLSCIIVDPREVEIRRGALFAGDFKIDLVYRRVLLIELMQKADEVKAFLDAYRSRLACFVNSFRCRLTENKSFFQFLSDPDHAELFSATEQAILARYIPWTRRVREGYTDFHGARIDLCDFMGRQRERFVLKPNDSYGGQGVCLGATCDSATWEKILGTALREGWVAQEHVSIPLEPFPVIDGETVALKDLHVNIGPYYIGGRYCGSIARASLSSVINVNAGGGGTPTFVVGEARL
ncbi:MAG: hypothetical protein HYR55_14525 [Acidobacteria bacterium]|nr:hypothetical protein [Acidobacteriota bacterium]MBI3656970.1 hypothetical protein [Acidobacteriota bacterium]